ncbi:MAG TPA: low temperature requirement protein A [Solirubrobacterales bacterium]|nr:low temperature requirement protein A [Solirubrobacterales bacterium]
MASETTPRARRISATLRQGESVTPLELFFDLVFVLAITQCTQLMADQPTWEGIAKGLLVLAVLWWSWIGYAWLTSVVDPEEGAVRLVIFAAMAGLLVCSLAVPDAFGESAFEFAVAYSIVRTAHIALFWIASEDDSKLRGSTTTLGMSTAIACLVLFGASFLDGAAQGAAWIAAIVIDFGGPYLFRAEGWKLIPEHFAERHGLIIIIALGESIVAIGAGVTGALTVGIIATAVVGVILAAMMWWAYFDTVALASTRRLAHVEDRQERNEMARDSYSYLHLPMVAGIVLVALGMKKTIGHFDEPLKVETATALLGGFSMYLLAHVAFRLRNVHSTAWRRLFVGIGVLALIPAGVELPALATLSILTAIACALIAYETIRFAEFRDRVRHQMTEAT